MYIYISSNIMVLNLIQKYLEWSDFFSHLWFPVFMNEIFYCQKKIGR